MSRRIIPTVLGNGRFSGIGPLPTFWSLKVNFGTVIAPVSASLNLLVWYNKHILRPKV